MLWSLFCPASQSCAPGLLSPYRHYVLEDLEAERLFKGELRDSVDYLPSALMYSDFAVAKSAFLDDCVSCAVPGSCCSPDLPTQLLAPRVCPVTPMIRAASLTTW